MNGRAPAVFSKKKPVEIDFDGWKILGAVQTKVLIIFVCWDL
jgi:hypothetical protein